MSAETLNTISFGGANPRPTRKNKSFALVSLLGTLHTWMERGRSRRHLASLNDNMLHDIGLSRADVEREVHKPVWVK